MSIEQLQLAAKHDHVKRSVKSSSSLTAVTELIWNALDADADKVAVTLSRNSLGSIEEISVVDDGNGMTIEEARHAFSGLGGSAKKTKRLTSSRRIIHGKEGQGRLHFHTFANYAEWDSISSDDEALERVLVTLKSIDLEKSTLEIADVGERTLGTRVKISGFPTPIDDLDSALTPQILARTFAPYLKQYPRVEITYEGTKLDPSIDIEREIPIEGFEVTEGGKTIRVDAIDLVVWKKASNERKIYLGPERGVILASRAANITAPGVDFSVYSYSKYFEEAHEAGLLEIGELSEPILMKAVEGIREKATNAIRSLEAEASDKLIQDLIDRGVYPYREAPANEVEKVEQEAFAITTRAATTYSRTFRNAKDDEKKVMLSLLKEAFKANPDSLTKILTAVFGLPRNKQDEFADVLGKTELANIIDAANFVADRKSVIEILRRVVFEEDLRKYIKERGELDKLVRDNCWLFREGYHVALHEAGLTRVLKAVLEDQKQSEIKADEIAIQHVDNIIRMVDGKTGRVDSFLGRSIPHPDGEKREYLVIELKRPKTTLTDEHVSQIRRYADALVSRRDYLGTDTIWNFYLIGADYDSLVRDQITQGFRPTGLLQDKEKYKIWVFSWAEVIRRAEGRMNFIADKLDLDIPESDILDRISELTGKL